LFEGRNLDMTKKKLLVALALVLALTASLPAGAKVRPAERKRVVTSESLLQRMAHHVLVALGLEKSGPLPPPPPVTTYDGSGCIDPNGVVCKPTP
jgi:hypothetical protein